ncbi:PREDICTED: nucleolar complex protein 4 homolog [Priapulus caudatus]|uniref:Nucleolar complex protein 4 homolog n=1 Tax=Priapulus caudatus TaxID=37621 RepID=A0ABM1EPZ4_PRICU|nr:PREDICTED: nucleolar complex protein 4 homolog [Priapulus caudatus]
MRLHCLRQVSDSILKKRDQDEASEVYLSNAVGVLEQLHMKPPEGEEEEKFYAEHSEDTRKRMSLRECKKLFTRAWCDLLRFKLTPRIYKKVLTMMHEGILPFMTEPLLLADFLTHSYNIGGAISLLSLHGLFVLISKHNLSRLAVTAPAPAGVGILVTAVRRQPAHTTRQLSCCHRPVRLSQHGLCDDPYVMEETDLTRTHAIDSSLWEVKSLTAHWYPGVATAAANLLEKPLPATEWNIASDIETNNDDF